MIKKLFHNYFSLAALLLLAVSVIIISCNEVSDSLAPYSGSPAMSNIQIQGGTFKPKVTWIGGYVTVFGVNRGSQAALDTSLVWLVYAPNDGVHYPVQFGTLPDGAQDITANYGGIKIDSLNEDNTYTFWVMKANAWNQVSTQKNKIIQVDTVNKSTTYSISADTIKVSSLSYFQAALPVNLYINISSVSSFGQLAKITVAETNKDNNPLLTWAITQSGVPDSMISAVGIVEGQEYIATNTVWEVWSVHDSSGTALYGKDDIISSPIALGQSFTGTQVFAAYPDSGLARGHYYYVWIADKTWDGLTRARFAKGYAYATFKVY